MLIGYARVSTDDQDTRLQIDALKRAGCEKIYEERASGSRTDRPELAKALAHGRKGDVVIVWKLDRLGRSLPHLIDTVHDLEERKVGFRSLTDNIDTTTASGRMFFHMMGALAQFERDLIRERTNAGLKAARELGPDGITVNAVAPGLILSEAVQANPDLTGFQNAAVRSARSLKRDAFPEDVEGTVVFLASDDSAFMSGQTLVVDGGSVFSTL